MKTRNANIGWDCSCNMSRPALYKFTYALIQLGGCFTDAFHLGGPFTPKQNARNTVFFRIFLPEGADKEFTRMTGMKLTKPPVVHLNQPVQL